MLLYVLFVIYLRRHCAPLRVFYGPYIESVQRLLAKFMFTDIRQTNRQT